MLIVGLTGSTGMGKSTTAGMFRRAGVPVHDADATVHRLYRGRAAPLVGAEFPAAVVHGVVDRPLLAAAVLGDAAKLARLESIVHPLVVEEEQRFIDGARDRGARLVLLDIPLLFETGAERRLDVTITVSASEEVQKSRVLTRPGMSQSRFAAIQARQMPDAEKRRRSHVVIDTGRGLAAAERAVAAFLRAFANRG